MNKILRLSMMAVLALVANMMSAAAYKTLSFPDEGEGGNAISAYDKTWQATMGTDTWTLVNFNSNKWANNWKWVKCGSKKAASVASIATDFAIDKAITLVTVGVDQVTTNKINGIKLITASDAAFTTNVQEVAGDLTKLAKGTDFTFNLTGAANLYYKLVIDCQQGSSNGLISIKYVRYYDAGNEPQVLTSTPEEAFTIDQAITALNGVENGEFINANVYVKGKISAIDEVSVEGVVEKPFGNATYNITADGSTTGATIKVYRGYYLDNEKFTEEEQINLGDEVIVYGTLKYFLDSTTGENIVELDSGNYLYSINGKTAGVKNITVDQTVNAPAFNLAGQRVNAASKGIVVKNGKKFLNK